MFFYCGSENERNNQNDYDDVTSRTPIETLIRWCAPDILQNERTIIERYQPNSILDVGCGTGNRLFDYLSQRGIRFLGIEKDERFMEYSKYQDKIIIKNFGADVLTLDELNCRENFDMITLFGGVIGGMHFFESRKNLFRSAYNLLNDDGKLVIDTLKYHYGRNNFDTDECGLVKRIFPPAPLQYFPSKNELNTLAQENNFILDDDTLTGSIPIPDQEIIYMIYKKR